MSFLAVLRRKRGPSLAQEPRDPILVGGSPEDHIADHCFDQIKEAMEESDVKKFRSALEAMVLNMFDFDGDHDAT